MKKYFEPGCAGKLRGNFDKNGMALFTIFAREKVVTRIVSVHAGPAHMRTDRHSRRRTDRRASRSRSATMRGTRHRVAQLDARFFLDYLFR